MPAAASPIAICIAEPLHTIPLPGTSATPSSLEAPAFYAEVVTSQTHCSSGGERHKEGICWGTRRRIWREGRYAATQDGWRAPRKEKDLDNCEDTALD
jgi:hypothetical protein